MFLLNTETDKSQNSKIETYFGQNIRPKPNRNDIRLSTRWFVVVVLFVAGGAAAGFFQTVYVYTPEVYPTKLRALAMGTHREAIQ